MPIAIEHNVRKLDIACRYGGEEFAIILPSTDTGTAAMVAERIRRAVEQIVFMVITGEEEQQVPLTISLGVSSSFGHQSDDSSLFIERTDKELYRAKQIGPQYHLHKS